MINKRTDVRIYTGLIYCTYNTYVKKGRKARMQRYNAEIKKMIVELYEGGKPVRELVKVSLTSIQIASYV